jgi:hypothetical protein
VHDNDSRSLARNGIVPGVISFELKIAVPVRNSPGFNLGVDRAVDNKRKNRGYEATLH